MSQPPKKRNKAQTPKNCFLRGEIWWAEIVVGGKRHRESLRTTDAREAERRIKAIRTKIERTAIGVPDEESWQEAVVRWATEGLSGVKPSVRTRYLSSIRNFNDKFGGLLIASIGTREIADWVRQRKLTKKATRLECGDEISNSSIQRDLTALSRLMSFCCSIGWRTDNPVQSFDRTILRVRRQPKRPPTLQEIDIVMRAAPAGVAGVLGILATTGMRLSEAVNLDRDQVDSRKRQVLLTKTKTSRPRAIAWTTPGGDATAYLEGGNKDGLLYPSETTQLAYANFSSNVGQVQRRILKENPFFPRFGVHDLRHAFAVRWLKAGGNIYRLARHLGHSSVKVTEQNYLGYLTVEEQERVQFSSEQGALD